MYPAAPRTSESYPKKPFEKSETENLARILCGCDEQSTKVIEASMKAALESQLKE